jgi:tetratricopeptide (TPR) repeat protein
MLRLYNNSAGRSTATSGLAFAYNSLSASRRSKRAKPESTSVAEHRNFRLLPGSEGRRSEAERLDRFLTDLADPRLISSLRREEQHRKRWWLAAAALLCGLLLGGGGMLLVLHLREPAASAQVERLSADATARILVSQGHKLMKVKEFEKAWADLRLATELAPDLVDAWDALGLAYFYGNQTADAERALRRCLEIDPEYSRAYHLLGDIGFYSGDWAQAKANWAKSGKRERAFARLALLENRFADAVPLIRQLVREVPDDPYVVVMEQALRAGRLTPELRLLLAPTYVVSRNPNTALGWRSFHARRYEEASAAFGRALRRQPRDGSAIIGRGWSHLKLGAAREAQSDFEKALITWPSNYSALNGMAWSLKAQGQTEGAVKLWQRVLELPHRPHLEIPESLKGLGAVYHERGDYARANLYLARSALLNPYDAETASLLENTLQKLSPPPPAAQTSP